MFEADSFLLNQPLDFSNFLITTSSPNFFLKISFTFPIPLTKPSSFDLLPDQNSPENNSIPEFLLSFDPLLSSTTFIKSLCKSS